MLYDTIHGLAGVVAGCAAIALAIAANAAPVVIDNPFNNGVRFASAIRVPGNEEVGEHITTRYAMQSFPVAADSTLTSLTLYLGNDGLGTVFVTPTFSGFEGPLDPATFLWSAHVGANGPPPEPVTFFPDIVLPVGPEWIGIVADVPSEVATLELLSFGTTNESQTVALGFGCMSQVGGPFFDFDCQGFNDGAGVAFQATLEPTLVPEPPVLALIAVALGGLLLRRESTHRRPVTLRHWHTH